MSFGSFVFFHLLLAFTMPDFLDRSVIHVVNFISLIHFFLLIGRVHCDFCAYTSCLPPYFFQVSISDLRSFHVLFVQYQMIQSRNLHSILLLVYLEYSLYMSKIYNNISITVNIMFTLSFSITNRFSLHPLLWLALLLPAAIQQLPSTANISTDIDNVSAVSNNHRSLLSETYTMFVASLTPLFHWTLDLTFVPCGATSIRNLYAPPNSRGETVQQHIRIGT
jgi:hypothetical protein